MNDVTGGNFHISGARVKVNGSNIGSLNQDGATVSWEPDIHFHQSAKFGSTPVAASIIGIEATIELNIGETTMNNLELAMAGSKKEGGVLNLGGVAGRKLTGVTLRLEPFDNTEVWVLSNAVQSGGVEVSYSPSDERVYTISFRGLIDTNEEEGEELGYVS